MQFSGPPSCIPQIPRVWVSGSQAWCRKLPGVPGKSLEAPVHGLGHKVPQAVLGKLCLPGPHATGLPGPCPQRMFAPALPSDLLVNVYINLNKLCLTVYQLHVLQPNSTKVRRTPLAPSPLSALQPLGPDWV